MMSLATSIASIKALRSRREEFRSTYTLERKEEIASGGTAIISKLIYSNGMEEIEKSLLPKFQARLSYEKLIQREFDILSELSHPLIVKVFRIERKILRHKQTTSVLIMEAVKGTPLSTLMSFIETLDETARKTFVQEFWIQMHSVLSYLEKTSIVHGDLVPENILVQPNGLLNLLDFGVSRKYDEPCLEFKIGGRSFHRAPELKSTGKTSREGDLFAVGRILEQLAGETLLREDPIRQLVNRLVEDRTLPTPNLHSLGWFSGLNPLPPAEFLKQSVRERRQTEISPRTSKFEKIYKPLVFLCFFLFLSSWLPQQAFVTINTLPYSSVRFPQLQAGASYETPVKALRLPSGDHLIEFVIPSQNNRHVTKQMRASPGEHLNIFEDFRNLDTFEK